jgi:hypothetical protein
MRGGKPVFHTHRGIADIKHHLLRETVELPVDGQGVLQHPESHARLISFLRLES